MKDIKIALKAVADHAEGQQSLWLRAAKKVWRTYLLLPLAAGVCAYGLFSALCKMIVPAFKLHAQTADWAKAFGMVAVDYLGLILVVLGLAAAIFASVKAHKSMLTVVTEFPQRELSSGRRNLLLTEGTMLVTLIFWVGILPIATLLLSGIAAGGSGLGAAPVAPPAWAILSLVGLTFLFVLALEIALTFIRLCFRELPLASGPAADVSGMLTSEGVNVISDAAETSSAPHAGETYSAAAEAPADFELKTK